MIQIICSYCKKDMGSKDGKGVEGVSHGVCLECLKQVMAELKAGKK